MVKFSIYLNRRVFVNDQIIEPQITGSDMSCKLSTKEIDCMKCGSDYYGWSGWEGG